MHRLFSDFTVLFNIRTSLFVVGNSEKKFWIIKERERGGYFLVCEAGRRRNGACLVMQPILCLFFLVNLIHSRVFFYTFFSFPFFSESGISIPRKERMLLFGIGVHARQENNKFIKCYFYCWLGCKREKSCSRGVQLTLYISQPPWYL